MLPLRIIMLNCRSGDRPPLSSGCAVLTSGDRRHAISDQMMPFRWPRRHAAMAILGKSQVVAARHGDAITTDDEYLVRDRHITAGSIPDLFASGQTTRIRPAEY